MAFLGKGIQHIGKSLWGFTKAIFRRNCREDQLAIRKLQEETSCVLIQLSSALERIEKLEETYSRVAVLHKCVEELMKRQGAEQCKTLPKTVEEEEFVRPSTSNLRGKERRREWSYTSMEDSSDRDNTITRADVEEIADGDFNETCNVACKVYNVGAEGKEKRRNKGFREVFKALMSGWNEKSKR